MSFALACSLQSRTGLDGQRPPGRSETHQPRVHRTHRALDRSGRGLDDVDMHRPAFTVGIGRTLRGVPALAGAGRATNHSGQCAHSYSCAGTSTSATCSLLKPKAYRSSRRTLGNAGRDASNWTAPWDEVVVKPVIGAGSVGVGQFRLPQQRVSDGAACDSPSGADGALLQRYEPSVRAAAERSLVFIAGAYSRAPGAFLSIWERRRIQKARPPGQCRGDPVGHARTRGGRQRAVCTRRPVADRSGIGSHGARAH